MKNCTYICIVLSALAALPAVASQINLLEKQQSLATKEHSQNDQIQDILNQYDKIAQSIDKTKDRLSFQQARALWRDYRWTTRGIHCLIDDYRNKIGEFTDTARADKIFTQYIPRIKEALSKTEEILKRYANLPAQTSSIKRDERWQPGTGRGPGSGQGYGRGFGRGYGYRWREQG